MNANSRSVFLISEPKRETRGDLVDFTVVCIQNVLRMFPRSCQGGSEQQPVSNNRSSIISLW